VDYHEGLAGLIVLFYLWDCLHLLDPDLVALAAAGGGRWRVRFGARRWQLAGKDPLLANPFDPAESLFLLGWRAGTGPAPEPRDAATAANRLEAAAAALLLPGRLCWISWMLAIVILPPALVLHLGPLPVMACAGALYVNVVLTGLVVYRRRDRLGLSGATIVKIWVECLLCVPYGVNLARKVALALPSRQLRLQHIGARVLDAAQRAQAWEECRARLGELMGEFDPGTAAHEALAQEQARWRVEP